MKKLTVKKEHVEDINRIFQELEGIREELHGLKQVLKDNQIFSDMLHKINEVIKVLDKQSKFTQQNMRDCQNMLQEFKGIMCIVRPEVKNTGWYGKEVNLTGPIVEKTDEEKERERCYALSKPIGRRFDKLVTLVDPQ